MHNKNLFSSLIGKIPPIDFRLTRTKLLLFALTLIAVGFALGGLGSGPDDATVASKVVNLSLPERHEFHAAPEDVIDARQTVFRNELGENPGK